MHDLHSGANIIIWAYLLHQSFQLFKVSTGNNASMTVNACHGDWARGADRHGDRDGTIRRKEGIGMERERKVR